MEKQLQVNKRVKLVLLPRPDRGLLRQPLASCITDIGHDTVTLAAPMYRYRHISLAVGQELKVILEGQTAVYSFVTTVIGHKSGAQPQIVVNYPTELVRTQRRRFVRIEFMAPVVVELEVPEGSDGAVVTCTGCAVDIGGGGVRLVMNRHCAQGTFVRIQLSRFPVANLGGRIVRSKWLGKGQWEWAVEFSSLTQSEQDQIMRFIFARQVELRRKGLL